MFKEIIKTIKKRLYQRRLFILFILNAISMNVKDKKSIFILKQFEMGKTFWLGNKRIENWFNSNNDNEKNKLIKNLIYWLINRKVNQKKKINITFFKRKKSCLTNERKKKQE